MHRPEVTGKKTARRKVGTFGVERAAYTIPEFCEAHRISEALYHKMKRKGLGPREAKALSKVIITGESAAEWRDERTDKKVENATV